MARYGRTGPGRPASRPYAPIAVRLATRSGERSANPRPTAATHREARQVHASQPHRVQERLEQRHRVVHGGQRARVLAAAVPGPIEREHTMTDRELLAARPVGQRGGVDRCAVQQHERRSAPGLEGVAAHTVLDHVAMLDPYPVAHAIRRRRERSAP